MLGAPKSAAVTGAVGPFRNGRPCGLPIAFVTGFQADGKTMDRPAGVTVDSQGAVIVADDLSNTLWRVTPAR